MMPAQVMRGLFALALIAASVPARAQTPPPVRHQESIQIGLSTDNISITAGFTGADLTIFGSLEDPDPLIARQGR
jgi:hypothetical protein